MIEVKNLFYKKNGIIYLNDISFSVKKGELVLLTGVPASNKTMLLKLIAGILKPSKGIVKVDEDSGLRQLRKKVAYLPQYFSVNENISGKEFAVSYINLNTHVKNPDPLIEIIKIFTYFEKLPLLEKSMQKFSFVEIRIFMMLLLLCLQPKVIAIDEPEFKDVSMPEDFFLKYVDYLKEKKITAILTFRIRNIITVDYDYLLLLHQGWLAYNAYWEQIKKNMDHFNIRIRPAQLAKYFKKYSGFEKAIYIENIKAMDVILKSDEDPYKIIIAFIKNGIKFDLVEIFKPNIKQFLTYKLEEFNIIDESS